MVKNGPRRNRNKNIKTIVIIEILILILLIIVFLFFKLKKGSVDLPGNDDLNQSPKTEDIENNLSKEELEAIEQQKRLEKEEKDRQEFVDQANRLKLSYDYDGAINYIKTYQNEQGGYDKYKVFTDAIAEIEEEKSKLLLYGGSYDSVTQFNHIFFHSLIADNSKAFDGDYKSVGYNMYMTTIYEFEKIINKMYLDGYVLVSMHDIAVKETAEDGSSKFVENKIYLPEGKKPFVLSIDDVSYYEYMTGDGFPTKLIIDDDGKVINEMISEDGSIIKGNFDVSPILDQFVEEHPDFSYKGAKGVFALTGYNGVLGYRTNDLEAPMYEEEVKEAKRVAQALKDNGWEFASHGWGHRNSLKISDAEFIKDTQRWLDEVEHILGHTDLFIFPFGVEFEQKIGVFTSAKYKFCKENGFDYFCGVEGKPWMQIQKDYVRMNRRPLDGQAMLQFPERLVDLFDVNEVIDPERPARDWD